MQLRGRTSFCSFQQKVRDNGQCNVASGRISCPWSLCRGTIKQTSIKTLSQVQLELNSVCVCTIWVGQVTPNDNPAFEPVTSMMDHVLHEGNEWQLNDTLSLRDLLPVSTSKFYRYTGSLTTPGCNEIVVWTVFDSPIYISDRQLSRFRILISEDEDVLVNNYRPAQPLMGRTVHVRNTGAATLTTSVFLAITALLLHLLHNSNYHHISI